MHQKKDLIDHLVSGDQPAFLSKAEAERAVNNVLDGIMSLSTGEGSEGLTLIGFGAFKKGIRAAREGHNPKTGEKIAIPEAPKVTFKIGKAFKDKLS